MADTKITALAAIATVDPAADVLPIVDISDTSMAASGTTKKVTTNQILGSSGVATLASATITGAATVGTTLGVTGVSTFAAGTLSLPALTTTGDTNTGIFFPAADTYAVTTGGTERYRVNSTGLGIGRSPIAKLNVDKAGQTPGGTTPNGAFVITDNVGSDLALELGVNSAGWPYIQSRNSTNATYYDLLINPNGGNVGIGVTPSTAWNTGTNLQVGAQAALYSNSALGAVDLSSNSVRTGNDTYQYLLAGSNQASRFQQRDGAFRWFSAAAGTSPNAITFGDAKMTLDVNGYLLVGKTSVLPSNAGCELQTGTGGNAASVFVADGAFASIMNRLTSDGTIIDFRRQTSSVGYIAVTTLATTYNSISDYRLKEAVQPLVGGLARVSALKPSIYKWKVNGSDGEGFLAHELAEVVPSAVTGEKDAVNEDGSIKAQGVDMSRIVPILVAAIQELTAEVNALKNA